MMDIPEEIQLAVKKGSYELTERYPEWYKAVVLEDLDMASSSACVLAHVAEHIGESMLDGYYTMLNLLFPPDGARTLGFMEEQTEYAVEHGFMEDSNLRVIEADPDEEPDDPDYPTRSDIRYQPRWYLMDQAWGQHIKELQER